MTARARTPRAIPATRTVQLAYGRSGLAVEVPADADVIEPRYLAGLSDEASAIRAALRAPLGTAPLGHLVPAGASVGVAVCDVTRPFPARRVLPVLLEALAEAGAGRVTIYIATGTHRLCTAQELEQMLGPDVLGRCVVVQHDAADRARHADLGPIPSSSVRARVERAFLEEDVRITTGFIEPHLFAGFSGGPKMVAPGLADLETVLELHSAARIGHPDATWGITEGNPVHDAVRAIAARAGVAFNVDVTLNREHAITRVFAGELFASHSAGCTFAKETAMAPVAAAYDVVLTTNSGYPLDQNLYQAVKGMRAADRIVKDGGTIVIASECADGLPEHGRYRDLLARATGPEAFLARLAEPGFSAQDQWQVQVQALVQRRARVFVKADGLSDRQLRAAWLEPAPDVSETMSRMAAEAGPAARVAVLPQGPQTIPYVRSRTGTS